LNADAHKTHTLPASGGVQYFQKTFSLSECKERELEHTSGKVHAPVSFFKDIATLPDTFAPLIIYTYHAKPNEWKNEFRGMLHA
jgi:hypothetical protein